MLCEFFLTLDIAPGFILSCIAEAVYIGKAAKVAGFAATGLEHSDSLARDVERELFAIIDEAAA